ncbi:ADP-ribosylglycohydrolase family protein [Saccharopolyspora hordei]|nr:ADP-ribosylglycohydrolase family protein [Saccharopolyspora hordei]
MVDERRDRLYGAVVGFAIGDRLGSAVADLTWSEIEEKHGPRGITRYAPAAGTGQLRSSLLRLALSLDVVIRADRLRLAGQEPDLGRLLRAEYERCAAEFPRFRNDVMAEAAARYPVDPDFAPSLSRVGSSADEIVRYLPLALWTEVDSVLFPLVRDAVPGSGGTEAEAIAGFAMMLQGCLHTRNPVRAMFSLQSEELDVCGPELRAAVTRADEIARKDITPAEIEQLGTGDTAIEAVAIALCAFQSAPLDPDEALRIAVNHSGNSAVTGALCGALTYASYDGASNIADHWLNGLVGGGMVYRVAEDAGRQLGPEPPNDAEWDERYPVPSVDETGTTTAEPGADTPKRERADDASPITQEMREAAKRQAGGYLYVTGPKYDPDGDVPSHAIKGAFVVDGNGEIGEDQANPNYQPSPVELTGPPANWIDRSMRRAVSGQIGQRDFRQLIAKASLPVLVTPEGGLMLLDAEGGARLTTWTASSVVPEGPQAKPLYLPRLLKSLPQDAVVVVNGSAELQAQFLVADLVAELRDMGLLVAGPSGELEVGPSFWVEQGARLARLIDQPTFAAVERALAQWGKLSEVTPARGRAIECGITAVETLVRGGVTDPDVLAATAAFNASEPLYGGNRTHVIGTDEEETRALELLRSAVSPHRPSDVDPESEPRVRQLVYHLYVEHLRASPWQVRAVVLANRFADYITPWVPGNVRDARQAELCVELLSCASDFPEPLRRLFDEEVVYADPSVPPQYELQPPAVPYITSAEQAVERARAVVDGLGDPVEVEDVGPVYLVRSAGTPGQVHLVHKVWETVTAEADDGGAVDRYRARHDVFPFTQGNPPPNPYERQRARRADPSAPHERAGESVPDEATGGTSAPKSHEAPTSSQERSAPSELANSVGTAVGEQPHPPAPPLTPHERFLGSMLAGALGDALGFAIEHHDIGMLRREFGPAGLSAPVLRDGLARVSDDTQMMLFTLEGLIRAHVARRMKPVDNDPVPEVQHAYQRWLHTQNQPWPQAGGPYARHLPQPDGWLVTNRGLFAARGPGRTCVSALARFAQTHQHGTVQHPVNDSKACGGVMRAAPVAVWSHDPAEVFFAAVGTAALTHGHPSGYLPAGVLAVIVHQLIRDVSLPESVRLARELLLRWRGHEEQLAALDEAVELAQRGPVAPEVIKDTLGLGRVGEEALAIGLYAALATDNLRDALLLAVNHAGDSDSTGIVCGTIAGALHGARAVPAEWLASLELREVIETVARDALAEFSPGPPTDPAWTRRYPAW